MNKDIELNNGAEAALLACFTEVGRNVGKEAVKRYKFSMRSKKKVRHSGAAPSE